MLQLILGRAGTGKLYRLYEIIRDLIDRGDQHPILLLVPEQASFDTERFLLSKLGAADAQRVQVFSFTRLAQTVLQAGGQQTGRYLDDGSRLLLLAYAADCVSDRLELYRKQVKTPEGLMPLKHLLTECKQAAVTPQAMAEVAARLPEGLLRKKLGECAVLFEAYNALLADRYLDPLDDLAAATAVLNETPLFAGAHIFIDSFTGFTAGEFALLAPLMRQAASFTVTLCADRLWSVEDEGRVGLFDMPRQTAKRLIDLANRLHLPVKKPVVLDTKAVDQPLAFLEKYLFQTDIEVYDKPVPEIAVTPCRTVWEESELAARNIRRLVRQGMRYRDIAVAIRDPKSYAGVLDAAMERMGIPYFQDSTETVMHDGIVTLLRGAMKAVCRRSETEDLLAMMKTGLLGISTGNAAKLENYVYIWQIPYHRFAKEWSWNPGGMEEEQPFAAAALAHINRLRRRLIDPLEALCRSCAGEKMTGRAFAAAVYRYLHDARVDRMTAYLAKRYLAAGMTAEAERLIRVWDIVMEQLDKLATLFEATVLSPEQLSGLLMTALKAVEYGKIPQSVDSVQIGCPNRMRFSHPKAVILLGVNEGVFPAYPSDGFVFGEAERKALLAEGLELSAMADMQYSEEQYYAYTAATEPECFLYLSYLEGASGGTAYYPSSMIQSVRAIFPQVKPLDQPADPLPENERDAFSLFAANKHNSFGSSIKAVLSETDGDRLAQLERASAGEPIRFADRENAAQFFGRSLDLSPTAVERFHQCRFTYFCANGLGITERRKAELNALTFGTVQHYVMETLLPLYGEEGFGTITKARVARDAAAGIDRFVEEKLGGYANKPARFAATVKRLVRFAGAMLWQAVSELAQSRFVPVYYELPIRSGAGSPHVEPPLLRTDDGATVRVIGKVDRVDVADIDGETYVRVVDYKTGSKKFEITDAVGGVNLQMLIYLFSICRGGLPRYGRGKPAGILYLPSHMENIKEETITADGLEKALLKSQQMNGLILNDLAVVEAMESSVEGLFIPVQMTAKGELKKSNMLATADQFSQLERRIQTLLCRMSDLLRSGDIAAIPTVKKNASACDHCPLFAVCGFEEGDTVCRAMTDKKSAWLFLENQEGWEGTADGTRVDR